MTNSRAGDVLGGPADTTRPSNPWPRILAFVLVVAIGIALAATCVISFASPPPREIRVPLANFQPGTPVFTPITTFGNDRQQRTYGVWIAIDANGRTAALLSRSAPSTCHIQWEGTTNIGAVTGAYVDPCGAERWSIDGSVLEGSATKDMEKFRTRRDGDKVVVDITRVLLGTCAAANTTGCSREGLPLERAVPKGALPPNFATN
ncbi:MAG: hypothetical protein EXR68_06640 [Dehalococcoidia bacterium]|nr:hypothetical protein [Dehalococcoidia bacterium]